MRAQIRKSIKSALKEMGISDLPHILIAHTKVLKNGDYYTNIAQQLVGPTTHGQQRNSFGRFFWSVWRPDRNKFRNAPELAGKIVEKIKQSGGIDGVEGIKTAGPGFVNFTLTPSALGASIEKAQKEDMWGANATLAGKKILVEYTDPNPFKEFHIGHLMSNAIGESVSRLLQFSGAGVKHGNYQGDVGPHVAKALWGLKKLGLDAHSVAAIGQAYVAGARAYEEDAGAKKEIDEINKKVYDHSDGEIDSLYAAGREATLAHFEELYKILGTKFDYYFFESVSAPKGLEIVRANPNVFKQSDGAVVFKGEEVGLHTRVFITSLGLPTYETKDLGLLALKKDTDNFDESITVTAHEQAEYFKVMIAAAKEIDALKDIASRTRHITHGMMRFAEGKMSSRTGNVITGESLLNELTGVAKERAKESRADDHSVLAQQVAVAAIKYQILKQGSGKDIIFDRERALSLEGDSGPYLQYAYARANQVIERAKSENIAATVDANATSSELSRLLHRFPEIVENATKLTEPHILATYLVALAAAFNSWYAQEQILDGTPAAAHKVALTAAFARTMKNGLWILGIPAPERM